MGDEHSQRKFICIRIAILTAVVLLIFSVQYNVADWIFSDSSNLDIVKKENWYRFLSISNGVCLTLSGVVFGYAVTKKLDSGPEILNCLSNVKSHVELLLCNARNMNCCLGSSGQPLESLVDQNYYLYMITRTQEEQYGCWTCYKVHFKESSPSCLTAVIQSSVGHGAAYKVEAFVRKNQLIIVINRQDSSEKTSSFIFPDFGHSWDHPMCGIGIGDPYYGDCLVRSAILSPKVVENVGEGHVPKVSWAVLDKEWNCNFKLHKIFTTTNTLLCYPIVGHWVSKAYDGNNALDIALIEFSFSAEGAILVKTIVVDPEGIILNTSFESTFTRVEAQKLTVFYNRPNAHNSFGVAMYFFDTPDASITDLYQSYTGHFADDKTSKKTVVYGRRITREQFETAQSKMLQSASKLSLTPFADSLSEIDERMKQTRT